MSGEAMGLEGVVKGIRNIYDSVKRLQAGKDQVEFGSFFEERVEPVFRQMERTHHEYIEGFQGFLESSVDGKLPPIERYEWLKAKRREAESQSKDIYDLCYNSEMQNPDFFISVMGYEIGYRLYSFVSAIVHYLRMPENLLETDYYYAIAEELQREDLSPNKREEYSKFTCELWKKRYLDDDEVKRFYKILKDYVDRHLPEKWDEICAWRFQLSLIAKKSAR